MAINRDDGAMNVFSVRLDEKLYDKKMKKTELARKTGIKRQNISNYCRGVSFPDAISLSKIAEALNVSADYLLGIAEKSEDDYRFTYGDIINFILKLDKTLNTTVSVDSTQRDDGFPINYITIHIEDEKMVEYYRYVKQINDALEILPEEERVIAKKALAEKLEERFGKIKNEWPELRANRANQIE